MKRSVSILAIFILSPKINDRAIFIRVAYTACNHVAPQQKRKSGSNVSLISSVFRKTYIFFSGRAVLFQFSRPLSGASRTAVKTGNEPVPCSVPRYRSVASVPATIMNLW